MAATFRTLTRACLPGFGALLLLAAVFLPSPDQVRLDPAQPFKPGEEIYVQVSRGMRDFLGLEATPYAWRFHTTTQIGYDVPVSGLGPGRHRVRIVALGTKHWRSKGTLVVFDGYVVQ